MSRRHFRTPHLLGHALLTWLASLRVRLIVTYVFVTVLSFGFLLLLLMKPVEKYIMDREEKLLIAIATTLGSTISTPWDSRDNYVKDLRWTQRRCQLYLVDRIPGLRVRVLEPDGRAVVDSKFPKDWNAFYQTRFERASLSSRMEVFQAMRHSYGARTCFQYADEYAHAHDAPYTMYIALPVLRAADDAGTKQLAFVMYLDRPVDSVVADLREMRQRIKISMLTSLLITVLAGVLLAGNLAAGIQSATRTARAFAGGEMSQRMRETGRDEVGQLGATFNQMADALQRQEQLRRDLLADVSHELRTPLTAIAGCADTLADGALRDDPATAERFLGIIVRESERMQRLVSDILELSRLQAGVVEMPRQPLPLADLIDDAVEIAGLHARQEGITIAWAAPARRESLVVLGNEDRLAQALRNLLDNARHHTPEGKRIVVTIEEQPDTLIVHISDEGDGIPPEDLPWVFDRFYRAGKGGAKTGGTGLGLAIVREILQAHQGRVTVESTLGQGTTFSLHLPRAGRI